MERDPAVVRDRPLPDRDEPDRLDEVLRGELERERDDALFEELRELLVLRRRVREERRVPPLRSAAGTSSRATAFES